MVRSPNVSRRSQPYPFLVSRTVGVRVRSTVQPSGCRCRFQREREWRHQTGVGAGERPGRPHHVASCGAGFSSGVPPHLYRYGIAEYQDELLRDARRQMQLAVPVKRSTPAAVHARVLWAIRRPKSVGSSRASVRICWWSAFRNAASFRGQFSGLLRRVCSGSAASPFSRSLKPDRRAHTRRPPLCNWRPDTRTA